jgi:hypothetical protein
MKPPVLSQSSDKTDRALVINQWLFPASDNVQQNHRKALLQRSLASHSTKAVLVFSLAVEDFVGKQPELMIRTGQITL